MRARFFWLTFLPAIVTLAASCTSADDSGSQKDAASGGTGGAQGGTSGTAGRGGSDGGPSGGGDTAGGGSGGTAGGGSGGTAGGGSGGVGRLTPVRTYAYHELTSLPAESSYWPVISGDGKTVAFATGATNPTRVVINVVNSDGTGQREIDSFTPLCYCGGFVDISADGQDIVSTESVQIRHARASGAANPVLTLDSNEIWDIRISADGTRIYFLLRRDAGIKGTSTRLERGVYIVNTDGTGLRQLTGPTAMAPVFSVTPDKIFPFSGCGRSLDVSTDKSRIAFAAQMNGMERVFVVGGAGTDVRKLVDASGGFKIVDKIALSGDGRLVGYHVYVGDGTVEFGVIGSDGSGRRKLATEPPAPLGGCQGNMRFTQDGSKLYVSDPSYLYNTDGNGLMQLSIGVVKPPGGSPVKEGTYSGWMNADGTRFVYKDGDDKGVRQMMLLEVNPASLGAAPVLTEPTFTPAMVTVAGLNTAISTVRASGAGLLRVGVAFTVDGLPDAIDRGSGIYFGDKGTNRDATAGDGVWTGSGFYGYYTPKPGPRHIRFTAESSSGGRRHATVLEASGMSVIP